MKNIKLKPTQKLLILNKDNLFIHNDARKALKIWHQFRPKTSDINMHALDDYYRQPLRLVAGLDDTYYFFNDFCRVDLLLREEMGLRQPCLIGAENLNDIKRLAWAQVLQLAFVRGLYHPGFFKAINNNAPKHMICELMKVRVLTIETYCQFAGISQSTYEYQQGKSAREEPILGLPKSMSWLE
ncbi:hypothetical protein [Psychrobacter sp. SZ93C1]|uniref:hypothetical protein n=1 Tax=Psychrobacter sp. SZ93C1 TaxID=2792058 RepID=UPI0018CEABA1|nr:hypothetical protein [Psychrobacter sp. SZ93C1]MBH0065131.1 hypothetical protein [Psychrobacter sp. SZ93C1]